jgi:hypothetical protein
VDIKVLQGESIPAAMAGFTVLCIHNLTPVKKVDPTWAVRRSFTSCVTCDV